MKPNLSSSVLYLLICSGFPLSLFPLLDIFFRFSRILANHKQSRLSIEDYRYLVEVSILTPNSQVLTISILGIGIVPIARLKFIEVKWY